MRTLALLLLAAAPARQPAAPACRVSTAAPCATPDPHLQRQAAPIGVRFPALVNPYRKIRA